MQEYVKKNFSMFKYPAVKLKNECGTVGGGSATGNLIKFTPTQDFVRHFFTNRSAYKGMLLFQSVGTGKTCSAIATATSSFEKEGYNILWVTRHTLKSDIWKNMYGQVCSLVIKDQLEKGTLKLPQKISGPMRYVSDRWMEPISYKQFSNMLLQKNKIYDEIVRRNGKEDPLRKTLVIIDEAHKLYSPTTVGSEKPNTDILERMIQTSYKVSGDYSVRILLMTGTPYTEDGMEMIKLLNLLRPEKDHLPADFDEFSSKYLDEHGHFTAAGRQAFQDDISGYVSYLNRSQDARNFAHPVLENVFVPLTETPEEVKEKRRLKELKAKGLLPPKQYDENGKEIKEKKPPKPNPEMEKLKALKTSLKDLRKELGDKTKDAKALCKQEIEERAADALQDAEATKEAMLEMCEGLEPKEVKKCKTRVHQEYKASMKDFKERKREALRACNDIRADDLHKLSKDAEMKEKVKQFEAAKQEVEAIMEKKKALGDTKKALMEDIKEARKDFNEKKRVYKKAFMAVQISNERIRKIKDKEKKKKARKELQATKGKVLKATKKEMQVARSNMVNLVVDKQLLMIKQGKGKLGDVSQQSAVEKRCLKESEDF